MRGRALHEASRLYWQSRAAGLTLPAAAFAGLCADEAHRIEAQEGLWVPQGADPGEARAKMADEIQSISGILYGWLSEAAVPVLIEKPLAVKYGRHEIVGRVDAISDGRILDLKTGARAWSQDQADHDIQLTAYAWLATANGLIDGAEVRAAVVCVTPRKVSVLETTRTATDIARLQARVAAVAQAMERDVYPPAVDGWWHHPDYCEYWYECPYAGGTPATGAGGGRGHIWD